MKRGLTVSNSNRPTAAASGQRLSLDSTYGLRAFDSSGNLWAQIPLESGPFGLLRVTGIAMLDNLTQTLTIYGRKDVGSQITLATGWGTAGAAATQILLKHNDQIQFFTSGVGRVYLDGGGLNLWNVGLLRNNIQVVGAQGAAVADASGGSTVDAEARTALNALLARLRAHGLIAT